MCQHFGYTVLDKNNKPYSRDNVTYLRSSAEKMADVLNKNANLECVAERAPFRVVMLEWKEL